MTKDAEVDFNVFVGAETGILKGINVHSKGNIVKNFHNLKSLEKQFEITCASFGDGEGEILMGLRNQSVKVYDVAFRSFSQSIETPGGSGPLVGIARHEGTIVTASEGGVVSYWKYPDPHTFDPIDEQVSHMGKLKKKGGIEDEEEAAKHRVKLREGRTLARLRQSCVDKSRVAVGGRETDMQVWDLGRPEHALFRAKNVRPDMLELRQEVWVSDIAWLCPNTVGVCSRHGEMRRYDVREGGAQRRPVAELVWVEESKGEGRVANTAIAALGEQQVIVGTSRGKLGLWDWRSGQGYKGLVRKYGGCVGAVKEISTQPGNQHFAAVGLDRFLRVWEHGRGGKLAKHKIYLKSRLNCVLLTSGFDPDAVRKEEAGVKNSNEGEVDVGEDDSVEVLDDSTDDVKEEELKEEDGDDIWDNMVVIDHKKRKTKEQDMSKSKRLK